MKKKLMGILKILCVDTSEIVIDIQLEAVEINSIEIFEGEIILHNFNLYEDLDLEINFEDISEKDKMTIINNLSGLLYN